MGGIQNELHHIFRVHTQQQRHYNLASYKQCLIQEYLQFFNFFMQQMDEKHSSTYECGVQGEEKKRYAKLTSEIKQLFIQKIVFENLSIKKASQLLNINYSSAKAIASSHKKIKLMKVKKNTNKKINLQCEYRQIQENQQVLAVSQVCSSIGGLLVSEVMIPKKKIICIAQSLVGLNLSMNMECKV